MEAVPSKSVFWEKPRRAFSAEKVQCQGCRGAGAGAVPGAAGASPAPSAGAAISPAQGPHQHPSLLRLNKLSAISGTGRVPVAGRQVGWGVCRAQGAAGAPLPHTHSRTPVPQPSLRCSDTEEKQKNRRETCRRYRHLSKDEWTLPVSLGRLKRPPVTAAGITDPPAVPTWREGCVMPAFWLLCWWSQSWPNGSTLKLVGF